MIIYPAISDFTYAYDNRAAVPSHQDYFDGWASRAARFREAHRPEEVSYGPDARHRFDLFRPREAARGLLVFLHGGWWANFSKDWFSHIAQGALERGYAVAIPSYTLCPDATIPEITIECGHAVEAAQALVSGPILLAGHSAGGHLAAMLACEAGPLSQDTRKRLKRVATIAGLHDLRPLTRIAMNEILSLTDDSAERCSPMLERPLDGVEIIAWVGGRELPEFRRQTAALATIWGGLGASVLHCEEPNTHHFDVFDALTSADAPLTNALLG